MSLLFLVSGFGGGVLLAAVVLGQRFQQLAWSYAAQIGEELALAEETQLLLSDIERIAPELAEGVELSRLSIDRSTTSLRRQKMALECTTASALVFRS